MLLSDEERAAWKLSSSLYWLESHLTRAESLMAVISENEHLTDEEQSKLGGAEYDIIETRSRILELRKDADKEYWRLKNERESNAESGNN